MTLTEDWKTQAAQNTPSYLQEISDKKTDPHTPTKFWNCIHVERGLWDMTLNMKINDI